jgi:hypothetical protein
MSRKSRFGRGVAIALVVGVCALAFGLPTGGLAQPAGQQSGQSTMESRLNQVIDALKTGKPPAIEDAINDGMEIIYGGVRPLPTEGPAMGQTEQADQKVGEAELRLAAALEDAARNPGSPPGALDLKLFIEEMNEVAKAVGELTRECGQGDNVNVPPCNELHPRLNEQDGQEIPANSHDSGEINPGYTVKIRGPAVPGWSFGWEETVVSTPAIAPGECSAVVKETRGLMVRLRFDRLTAVSDPWVSTFGVPRRIAAPIWTLSWIPAQYVKEINICNSGGDIEKEITQRVIQDPALSYFWRMYPKDS